MRKSRRGEPRNAPARTPYASRPIPSLFTCTQQKCRSAHQAAGALTCISCAPWASRHRHLRCIWRCDRPLNLEGRRRAPALGHFLSRGKVSHCALTLTRARIYTNLPAISLLQLAAIRLFPPVAPSAAGTSACGVGKASGNAFAASAITLAAAYPLLHLLKTRSRCALSFRMRNVRGLQLSAACSSTRRSLFAAGQARRVYGSLVLQ